MLFGSAGHMDVPDKPPLLHHVRGHHLPLNVPLLHLHPTENDLRWVMASVQCLIMDPTSSVRAERTVKQCHNGARLDHHDQLLGADEQEAVNGLRVIHIVPD